MPSPRPTRAPLISPSKTPLDLAKTALSKGDLFTALKESLAAVAKVGPDELLGNVALYRTKLISRNECP
jgi:hypothetical protein